MANTLYEDSVILNQESLNKLVQMIKGYPIAGNGTGIILVPSENYEQLQIQNALKFDSTLELQMAGTADTEDLNHPACIRITDTSIQTGSPRKYLQAGSLLEFSPSTIGTTQSDINTIRNSSDIGTFSVIENNGTKAHLIKIRGFENGKYNSLDETDAVRTVTGGSENSSGVYTYSSASLDGAITTKGGISAAKRIRGYKLYGAVFNDYAEYRQAENVTPGNCVIENGDGSLSKSTDRLQPGANIVSDTFGFSIGETDKAQTPIAVCGRVLAYPLEDKNVFKAGDAVCSGPNGTISLMTREEIKEWPDRIVGYVSEIPTYEKWGSDNIEVRNRIWIKVK